MTHKLQRLDHSGHTAVEWDVDAAEAVAEAERIFNEAMATNTYLAYKETPEGCEQIHTFEPEAATIVLAPRLVAG